MKSLAARLSRAAVQCIPNAWERIRFGNPTTVEADGDGFSDLNEHLADTGPLDPASLLRIAALAAAGLGLIPPDAGATTARTATNGATSRRFFRVQAVKPLSP